MTATGGLLSDGVYDVTIQDANLCGPISYNVTITEPAAPLAVSATTIFSPTCNGFSNGTIGVTVTGGTAPYAYLWNNAAMTSAISGLAAGIYGLTVTDANGCTDNSIFIFLSEPDALAATPTISDVTCNGLGDGSVTVAVTGGTAPYNYLWSSSSATSSTGLQGPGPYTVTVTDAQGCVLVSGPHTVNEPAVFASVGQSQVDVLCNGFATGVASVTVTGGNMPHTYTWSDAAVTATGTRTGLMAGIYDVTVTDQNLCGPVTFGITITEPAAISATAAITDVSCFGGSNGAATFTVSGGVSPYTYNWSNGNMTSALTNLVAGSYQVTVTDANSCVYFDAVTINEPAVLASTIAATDITCFGDNDGTVTVTPIGGTSPYSYVWTGPSAIGNTPSANSLMQGAYSVTITDNNFCTQTLGITITEPTLLTLSTTQTNVTCNGFGNGKATAVPGGGIAPYSYSWSTGSTAATITGLVPGIYDVTLTDNNGCLAGPASVTITEPAPLSVLVDMGLTQNVTCHGGNDGEIYLTVSGGTQYVTPVPPSTQPYNYLWNDGATVHFRTGLVAATYTVTVSDANGCVATANYTITQPTPWVTSAVATNASCNGGANGSINLSVSGNTAPYTYIWSNLATTEDISGLTAATYYVTITDANLCVTTESATVGQPDPIVFSQSNTHETCWSANDGTFTITVSGGTAPYSLSWSNLTTATIATDGGSASITGLVPGPYTFTVTDANTCNGGNGSFTVNGIAAPVVVSEASTNVTCNGFADGTYTINVTGGTAPYSLAWSNSTTASIATDGGSASITGLAPGAYSAVVTDANGCAANTPALGVTITEPAVLTATASSTDITCFGFNDGTASVVGGGGTMPYSYLWSTGATTAAISGLAPGTYTVMIMDANFCVAIDLVPVFEPTALTVVANIDSACHNTPTGSITLTISGATPGYFIAWSNGYNDALAMAGTSTNMGLAQGNYTVTVQDVYGCTFTQTYIVNQPLDPIVANFQITPVSCNGGSDAQILNTGTTGGVSPYTYSWSNGQTTPNAVNVSAGLYQVTVTDAIGCQRVYINLTVLQPDQLLANGSTTVSVTCNGGNDGSINFQPTGGTFPYTYLWNTGAITQDISGLVAGTYTVTLTDNNNCLFDTSFTINEPPAIVIALDGATDTVLTCFGDANGIIDLNVSGGVPGYTYLWSNGATTEVISGLVAGTYSVVVTDANGCTDNASYNVVQPAAPLAVAMSMTAVSCFGGSNGTATATVTGGWGSNLYVWSNGGNTATISGLTAGTYGVTVTDLEGCVVIGSITVTQPTPLVLVPSQTNVSCFGGSNGTATVTASGATPAYSYLWSNGGMTSTITGLIAGTYTVTVTDANMCTETASVTITQPPVLTVSGVTTDAICFGSAKGTITLTIGGGTPDYSYIWSNAATTQNLSGLVAGTYSVTVTDANSCTNISSYTVMNPPSALASSASATPVSCFGGNNGTATVVPTGGWGGYTYLWSNGGVTATITGLVAGTYTVTVTDNLGCTTSASATVTQPALLVASIASVTPITCAGGNDGSIDINVAGGTTAYSYLWSNGATTQDISGLVAGTYSVTVTDANMCFYTTSTTLTDPTPMTLTMSGVLVGCPGANNGFVTATFGGGAAPYNVTWMLPNGVTFTNTGASSPATITNLSAGTYMVTITDNLGCTVTGSQTLNDPTDPDITVTAQSNVSCFGGANGSVTVQITDVDATAPYYVYWNVQGNPVPFQIDTLPLAGGFSSVSGLVAGTYRVFVEDFYGCDDSLFVTITEPALLQATAAVTATPLCNTSNEGAANVTVAGGTAPYTYLWSNGAMTSAVTGLVGGTYTVTVTDALGCTDASSVNVVAPAALALSAVVVDNFGCVGAGNGSIDLTVVGGTAPFTYVWSNGAVAQDIIDLLAGIYNVTVTDLNNCVVTGTYTVADGYDPIVLTTTGFNVDCNGNATGSIALNINNGNPPYFVTWSNGVGQFVAAPGTVMLNNLVAGTYTATVTDLLGCVNFTSQVINEPAVLVVGVSSSTNASCFGFANGSATVTVTGGTMPYSYVWTDGSNTVLSTSATASGLAAGTYYVTVTDGNNCETSTMATITEPAILAETAVITNVLCNGAATGAIDVTVSGGTAPYSYLWAGGAATQDRTGLTAGTYTVTITDNQACVLSASYTIVQPTTAIAIAASVTNVSCNGLSDGAIDITVTGGVAPYSYSWSNGATTQDLSGLAAGSYTGTITDANNCTITGSISVTQPMALSSMVTTVSVTGCAGGFNGSAFVAVTGGTAPYSYVWSNGTTTANNPFLFAGTYSVTVTDAKGCMITENGTVTEPVAVALNITSTNITCNGDNDGTITTNVTGGTPPYTYLWNNGATTSSLSGLAPGSYFVQVDDYYGCDDTMTVVITEPAVLMSSVPSVVDVACFGDASGSVFITVTGGTMPYSYVWSNGDTNEDALNVIAGSYSVTITDFNGCVTTAGTAVVTEPAAALDADITSSINVDCNGNSTGSADLTVMGGTSPYDYLWSDGQTTEDATGLFAGVATVTVTDANGCVDITSVTITEPAVLMISAATQDSVSCFGFADGAVNITVTGGTMPYTYMWSNGSTDEDLTGVTAGTYTGTITDFNGCMTMGSVTVLEPNVLTAVSSVTNVSCFGGNDGAIDLATTGGTTPYSYLWNTGATTSSITGLTVGVYSVVITDANSCTFSMNVTVAQPSGALTITNINRLNVLGCYGDFTGAIDISVAGGTAPYTYIWSNGAITQDISGLAAGGYSVTVTDANGCTTSGGILVWQPDLLVVNIQNVTNVNCQGGVNGSIDMQPLGGTSPYTYAWSNGAVSQDITNLPAGTYTVTLTDVNGCVAIDSVTINQPPVLAAVITSVVNVACYSSSTGAVNATVTGGVLPYTYSWSNGANTEDLVGVPAGTYVLNATDACGDVVTVTATVTEPAAALSASISATNVLCFGDATGVADLTVSGGTAPFTFNWSNGAVTEDLTGVSAGTYSVGITDANGCFATATITIAQPAAALNATLAVTNISCNGGMNGAIDMSVTGGTTPYSFVWSTGATTEDISGLGAGIVTVTITDGNGCVSVRNANVTQPAIALAISSALVQDASCNGSNDGAVNITVVGGTAPYTFSWSNGANTEDLSNVAAGSYTGVITDANGCTISGTVTVGEPAAITASTAVTNVSCFGGSNGSVNLTVSGGQAPYTFNWGGGITTEDLTNVPAGVYNVVITDANGCSVSTGATISGPAAALLATGVVGNVSCNGGNNGSINLTVVGGTAPYTYAWSNGAATQDITGVTQGSYSVVVTDANGCTSNASFVVTQPAAALTLQSANVSNVSCFGGTNGSIDITIVGGTPPYTFSWSNGAATEDLVNVGAGTYTGVVTDANGCTISANATITQPASLISVTGAVVTSVSCFGGTNGAVDITVSGGTPPYTYNWSNGAITQDLSNVGAGTYTGVITDANGCTFTASVNVTQPSALAANIVSTNVLCAGASTGVANLTVSGGTAPYTYNWSNGAVTEDLTAVAAGSYNVIITDANGCTVSSSVVITQPTALSSSIVSTNVLCNGGNNGSATANVFGGTPPYTFLWNNGAVTQNINGLAAGNYTVVITDANGCTTNNAVAISQPTALAVDAISTQNSGQATAVVTGGTPPYSFIWSPTGGFNQTATGLVSGTYSVLVTDANGCTATDVVIVENIGIEEETFGSSITMYPNPTAGITYVAYDFSVATDVEVRVYNAIGAVIFTTSEFNVTNGKIEIDGTEWSNGVYFVQVTDGRRVSNNRLIIQK
jgi:hypothetical protein